MQIWEILQGRLYQGNFLDDWKPIAEKDIRVIIDLEGRVDKVPTPKPDKLIYLYHPIVDGPLPSMGIMNTIADFACKMIGYHKQKVLSHCAAGRNRASLMNGLILHKLLKIPGDEIVKLIRERRPGALSNQNFANYLLRLK